MISDSAIFMADTDPEYRASETADDEVSEVSSSPKKAKGGGKLTLKCSWTGCCKVFHKHRHLEDHYRTHTGEVTSMILYKNKLVHMIFQANKDI